MTALIKMIANEDCCEECDNALDLDGWDGKCGECADASEITES